MKLFEKMQPLAGNMDGIHIIGNILLSRMMGLEEVLTPETVGKLADPAQTVCFVNPGPSARTEEALGFLNAGVDENGKPMLLVLANAGYNMLHKGLNRADYFVANHPGSAMVEGIETLGDHDMEYLIASMAPAGADPQNPSVIEALMAKGRTPKIWHAEVTGVTSFKDDIVSVGTASGAPVAAMALFAAMGYKKFQFFGMDGSSQYAVDLADTQRMHDYLKSLPEEDMSVQVGEKIFTVNRTFWAQTQELMTFITHYPEAVESIKFSGQTANAAIFNSWDGQKFTCGPIKVLEAPPAPTQSNDGQDQGPEPFTPSL